MKKPINEFLIHDMRSVHDEVKQTRFVTTHVLSLKPHAYFKFVIVILSLCKLLLRFNFEQLKAYSGLNDQIFSI